VAAVPQATRYHRAASLARNHSNASANGGGVPAVRAHHVEAGRFGRLHGATNGRANPLGPPANASRADMEEPSSRRYFGEFDAFDGPATASVRRMLRVRITERPESGETSVRSGHFAICLFDGGRTSGFSSRTSRRKTTAFLVRWVRITVVGLPGCPHFPHCLLSCPLGDLPECLRIRA
jgi:hypothetical protein